MNRRLTVPGEVQDVVRKALAANAVEVPDVAYRLASGWALPDDRAELALWCLDNGDQFNGRRCTLTAALRGGNAGMRWAMTAALTGVVDPALIEAQLGETVRSDQLLVPQLAGVIAAAWDRTLDHAARKARSRVNRTSEGRHLEFAGWPNADVARRANVDDLVEHVWDSLVITLTTVFGHYARTQGEIVAVADPGAGDAVRQAINGNVAAVVNALIAFLDQRARQFLTGEVPYRPVDFEIARVVAGWLSGASGPPEGFTFAQLDNARFTTGTSTAQATLIALLANRLVRSWTWFHSFYGVPLKPYLPHLAIDGQTFTESEFDILRISPGDHVGCLCEVVPGWSIL